MKGKYAVDHFSRKPVQASNDPIPPQGHTTNLASQLLAMAPAKVASSAPAMVKRVLVTFAARKYTLMV